MNSLQLCSLEALKKYNTGTFIPITPEIVNSGDTENRHIRHGSSNYENMNKDFWWCTWYVDIIGALFLASVRINNGPKIDRGIGPSWWARVTLEKVYKAGTIDRASDAFLEILNMLYGYLPRDNSANFANLEKIGPTGILRHFIERGGLYSREIKC